MTAVFEPADEGGYVCWLEEMPGVQSQGDSLEEARTNLLDALKLAVEYLRDRARQESSPQSVREIVELPAKTTSVQFLWSTGKRKRTKWNLLDCWRG